jgi:4-amino-4-deoxy-L-arabinose transferase-like glycosyltransferase
VFSIAVKVAILLLTQTWGSPRTWEYEPIAVNLVEGRGYVSQSYVSQSDQPYRSGHQPVYPVLCALLYWLFGHHREVVQLAQILAATLLCLVAYDLARRLFSVRAGLWSAWLVAMHPGLSYYSTANLHVLVFDALFFLLVVWTFVLVDEGHRLKHFIASGLALGFALLSRASVLAFMPVGLVWLWWRAFHRVGTRKLLLGMCVMLSVAWLIVAPWLIRNYRLYGRPVYFLSTVGMGLWIGNNAHASGSTLSVEGEPIIDMASSEFLTPLRRLSEAEQDDYFRREAIAYMAAHPWRTAQLYGKKLLAFWWFSPQSGLWYPRSWLRLYRIWYVGLLLFVGLGFWAVGVQKAWARAGIIPLFGFSIAFCQSLFLVEGRHRWEVEALLVVVAANGLSFVQGWATERIRRLEKRSFNEQAA